MSVSENDAARQVNSANLRQWSAVLAADEWQRAWEALAEPEDERAAAAYVAAQARGDEYAAYCALRAEEQAADRRVPCDGCKAVWDLEECVVTADEEIICPDCLAAPYATEGVEL